MSYSVNNLTSKFPPLISAYKRKTYYLFMKSTTEMFCKFQRPILFVNSLKNYLAFLEILGILLGGHFLQ